MENPGMTFGFAGADVNITCDWFYQSVVGSMETASQNSIRLVSNHVKMMDSLVICTILVKIVSL